MKLTPFKRWTLENFPFIEADFDAITNYQLYCKIVEYLNKVIASQNATIEQVEAMQEYLDSLDIQELVDNKLDEMAESGQLTDIIAQYLNLAGVLAYNTIADLEDATNIVAGSICYTLGENTYNDGKGAFYKVRNVTTSDTIDGFNIVAITNDNTIIGERLPNYYINSINTNINNINTKLESYELLKNKRFVFIGDSYVTGTLNGVASATDGWAKRIKDNLGLSNDNCFIYGEGGSGFTAQGHQNHTFYDLLNNNLTNITNKNTIDYIVVCGGYNDRTSTISTVESAISQFSTLVSTNFPNAKLYIGCISNSSRINSTGTDERKYINLISLIAYKNCEKYKAYYLNGSENILKDYSLMGNDFIHPSIDGYNMLAYSIIQILETGYYSLTTEVSNDTVSTLADYTLATGSNLVFTTKVTNDSLMVIGLGTMFFESQVPFNTGADIKLCHINSNYIRKLFSYDLWLNGAIITAGSSRYYLDGYLFINDDNDLVMHILDYPSGITQGNRIDIRSYNTFNINA